MIFDHFLSGMYSKKLMLDSFLDCTGKTIKSISVYTNIEII